MIPWWSGLLLFMSGIFIGAAVIVMDEAEDQPKFKYNKKGK